MTAPSFPPADPAPGGPWTPAAAAAGGPAPNRSAPNRSAAYDSASDRSAADPTADGSGIGRASRLRPAEPRLALHEPGAYRPDIDGLRALAVLAVLVNHIDHRWLPGGYLGVDLFFVISGWVVTGSLLRHSHTSWRQFLLAFYARRVRRLLPALAACVLLSSLLGMLVIAPQALERLASLRTGLTSLVGLSNLYQLRQSTDYFGSSAELNLFTHTWSLGVEEQYYLLYPLLVGACGLVRGRPERLRRRLIPLLSLLVVASLLLQGHLWASDQASAAFFLMTARFWELGLGALGCLLLPALGQRLARLRLAPMRLAPFRLGPIQLGSVPLERLAAPLAPLAFALVVVAALLPLDWQQPATLLAGFASALLLPALARPSGLRRALSQPWLVALGLRSYSLYLWHWPVLVLARWTVGLDGWWLLPVLLLVAGLSEASYRWLETPLRRRPWGRSNRATLARGGLLLALAGASLLGLERRGEALFIGQHRWNEGPWFASVGVAGTRLRGDRCNAIPTDGPAISAAMLRDCRQPAGRPGARPLAILGDSHALQLMPLLERLRQHHGLPVLLLSRSACLMPAPGLSVQAGCQPFSQAAVDQALAFTAPAAAPGAVPVAAPSALPAATTTLPATPITAQPTTAQPTTAQAPTAQAPTVRPLTAQPTTAQPPTAQPPTVPPTTAPPTTAAPPTAAASSTAAAAAGRTTAKPGSGGIVVLSNYLFGHVRPGGDLARQFRRPDGGIAADPAANLAAWGEAVGALADRLARQGGTLVVVAPTPEQRSRFGHPQLCRTEWFRPQLPPLCRRSSTSRERLLRDREPILRVLQAQAQRHANLLIFDPFDSLCPAGGDCSSHAGRSVLYRDKDHLSTAAVVSLVPSFEALLQRHGLL